MKIRCVHVSFSTVLIIGILLSGCQPQAGQASAANFVPQTVAAANCSYGGEIRSVEAIDVNTVMFTLCKTDTSFLSKISSPIFAVQDEYALDQTGGDSQNLSSSVNGTGPYRLTKYSPGVEAILEPSSSYWGVPPKPQKITFRWVPDSIVRYRDFTAANADVLLSPPAGLIMLIRDNKSLSEISQIGLNTIYIGINNKVQPFNNPKVRQALATLINREYISSSYLIEGSESASQLVPSTINPGFSANIPWYTNDSATARALLTEAGFDFTQHLSLAYPDSGLPGVDSPAVIAQEIKKEMADIGVALDLKRLPEVDLRASIAAGSEMLYLYWFNVDYPDGLAFFEKPFVSDIGILGQDYPDVVSAIDNLRGIDDANQRQSAFNSINRLMKDTIPVVPISHALDVVFAKSSLKNLLTNGLYQNFEDVSSPTGELLIYSGSEPSSFWPADETSADTFEVTRLLYDTLLTPAIEGGGFEPLLAESWESNSDFTQWTFHLRYDVRFSNSAYLDANDVVASFSAIWKTSDPNHKGRTGEFTVFKNLFGNFTD